MRIFTYSLYDKVFHLVSSYFFAAIFTWVLVLNDFKYSSWTSYLSACLILFAVFAAIAYFNYRKNYTLPTTIKVDNTTVILSRFWEYQRFDLADVMWVTETPEQSPLLGFVELRRPAAVTFISGGKNKEILIWPDIDGYKELLKLFSSSIAKR